MDNAEIAWQALWAADWLQTRQIAKAPDVYFERNKFLGEHPTPSAVNAYFAFGAIGHYAISQALPPRWRETWQAVTIVYQAGTVVQNYSIGLEVKF
jgi:hypothetical protein